MSSGVNVRARESNSSIRPTAFPFITSGVIMLALKPIWARNASSAGSPPFPTDVAVDVSDVSTSRVAGYSDSE